MLFVISKATATATASTAAATNNKKYANFYSQVHILLYSSIRKTKLDEEYVFFSCSVWHINSNAIRESGASNYLEKEINILFNSARRCSVLSCFVLCFIARCFSDQIERCNLFRLFVKEYLMFGVFLFIFFFLSWCALFGWTSSIQTKALLQRKNGNFYLSQPIVYCCRFNLINYMEFINWHLLSALSFAHKYPYIRCISNFMWKSKQQWKSTGAQNISTHTKKNIVHENEKEKERRNNNTQQSKQRKQA